MVFRIERGLDLPITGEPLQQLALTPTCGEIAVTTAGMHGVKPSLQVEVGSRVKRGQALFFDKTNPAALYTSPSAGEVVAIHRGERRRLLSVVLRPDPDGACENFASYHPSEIAALSPQTVRDQLLASGLWTRLRTRPFSKVPPAAATADSLFVTATDTNALAPYPNTVIDWHAREFEHGLRVLDRLELRHMFLCVDPYFAAANRQIPQRFEVCTFDGPHPAGLAGTHIHLLRPVSAQRTAWVISYSDVIAIGELFATGRVPNQRTISVAGPLVREPQLYKVQLGCKLSELVAHLTRGEQEERIISGPVLNGTHAVGAWDYLGVDHRQVVVLAEGRSRHFLSFFRPGFDKFSIKNAFFSKLLPGGSSFAFTTSTQGSPRAMVPVESYEAVMPFDTEPTFLLRALLTGDHERAVGLGALELDEEDLALCTFVCPGKTDYGPYLRQTLTAIEKEG